MENSSTYEVLQKCAGQGSEDFPLSELLLV